VARRLVGQPEERPARAERPRKEEPPAKVELEARERLAPLIKVRPARAAAARLAPATVVRQARASATVRSGTSAILPSPNCIRKMSDRRDSVTYAHVRSRFRRSRSEAVGDRRWVLAAANGRFAAAAGSRHGGFGMSLRRADCVLGAAGQGYARRPSGGFSVRSRGIGLAGMSVPGGSPGGAASVSVRNRVVPVAAMPDCTGTVIRGGTGGGLPVVDYTKPCKPLSIFPPGELDPYGV
jgi:hypothetical protein